MKRLYLVSCLMLLTYCLQAQQLSYQIKKNIPYYPDSVRLQNEYIQKRCVLDIYYPQDTSGFATIVWFHGGGLSSGEKEIPPALKNQGMAIIGVNYRLHPKVKSPEYVEDAAASVAWAIQNIEQYGGDSSRVFVSGHSAGGYLTSMVGLDKRWLAKYDIKANRIAGLIPFSGHTITHFTIRKERDIAGTTPVVDDMAPLYHVRDDAPPLVLITGDRDKEMLGRYEENAFLMRMMKVAGHQKTKLYELEGYGHLMTDPAFPLLIEEVNKILEGTFM